MHMYILPVLVSDFSTGSILVVQRISIFLFLCKQILPMVKQATNKYGQLAAGCDIDQN